MLFRPEDLNYGYYDPIQEAADILNESVYLTEEESIVNAFTIPIIENSRIGANVIRFSSLEKFSEDNFLSYIDAIQTKADKEKVNESIDGLVIKIKDEDKKEAEKEEALEDEKRPDRDKKVTPKKLTKKSDASEEATEEDK